MLKSDTQHVVYVHHLYMQVPACKAGNAALLVDWT